MTVFYSDLALSKDYGDMNTPKGVVLASKAVYTVPVSVPQIADTIQMNPIPKGAIILDVILESDGGNASLTLTVGDGTDADMFIASFDASAAALKRMDHAGVGAVGKAYAAAGHVIITTAGAVMVAADVYTCIVTYMMP